MVEPAIRCDGVHKHFGSTRALDGLDLTVEAGELYGFLGPNGAGKTTAIRLMLDLQRPTAGIVRVFGFDAQRQSIEVRRRVSYLPSEARMYEHMTGLGYLELLSSLRDGVDPRRRDELIDRLEVEATREIGDLSRGNQQKVGLVAALMSSTPLVVLDEPTSGLDPLMQGIVRDLLREEVAEGRTVFFSSHRLAEVEELCTRVAVLNAGRVIDEFSLDERRRIAALQLHVTFAEPPSREDLERVPDAPLVRLEGPEAVFEIHDGVTPLLQRLAKL